MEGGNRPILELVGEAKAEVHVEEEELDDTEVKDNLREDLDTKSLDIDIDKMSISDKSESTEPDTQQVLLITAIQVLITYSHIVLSISRLYGLILAPTSNTHTSSTPP